MLMKQAAQFFLHCDIVGDFISQGKLDVSGETIIKKFCQDALLAISNCFSAGTFSILVKEFVETWTGDSVLSFLWFPFSLLNI